MMIPAGGRDIKTSIIPLKAQSTTLIEIHQSTRSLERNSLGIQKITDIHLICQR
jgi:hypothetical protein